MRVPSVGARSLNGLLVVIAVTYGASAQALVTELKRRVSLTCGAHSRSGIKTSSRAPSR